MRLASLVYGTHDDLETAVRWRQMRFQQQEDASRSDQLVHRLFVHGELLAYAASFRRTILGAGGRREVLALAGVKSHPGHRGRGFGVAVVRAAFARVDARLDACLFQTGVPVFYRKLGARALDNPFVNRACDARAFWEPHAMIWPASAAWPAGEIDLNGEGWW